jgi:MoxR-like ATPase
VRAAKIRALLDGRYNVAFDDIRVVAPAALRHRILLNFEGEAEGVTSDRVLREVLGKVAPQAARPVPQPARAAK